MSNDGREYVNEIPIGWQRLKGSWTEPIGYEWYFNGKSLFSKEFKAVLVKKVNQ